MADFYIRKGDRLPEIQASLYDGDDLVDLSTSLAVKFVFRPVPSGTTVIGTATITNTVNGGVKYSWGASDTTTPGEYHAYWKVTFTGSLTATYPNRSLMTFQVLESLD